MNNKNLRETEVKLLVDDLSVIKQRLQALNAELVTDRVFERNTRYENEAKTLTQDGIVVRLRQDNRVRLTYKDGGTTTEGVIERFEAEVTVDDFSTMDVILDKLGYQAHMTYEKYRTTYALNDTEIVLDELPYGHFVEIEGAIKDISNMITLLHLDDVQKIPMSYTRLFALMRAQLDLTFDDLTFENFEGVEVGKALLLSIVNSA